MKISSALDLLKSQACCLPVQSFVNPTVATFFASPGIVEVYGPSGAGKSTLAMQYLVAFLLQNREKKAMYICTDSQFSIKRFVDLCCGHVLEAELVQLLDRVIVQHLGDLDTQEHFLNFFLEPLIVANDAFCIVIDTISANFRIEARTPKVTSSLYSMAHKLNQLSALYDARIIAINQVTDNFSNIIDEPLFKPALGLSWSNCVSAQLEISKVSEDHFAARCLRIIRCSTLPPMRLKCSLSSSGFELLE